MNATGSAPGATANVHVDMKHEVLRLRQDIDGLDSVLGLKLHGVLWKLHAILLRSSVSAAFCSTSVSSFHASTSDGAFAW